MGEGKIKGRMEKQGGRFFLVFFLLIQTTRLVVEEFRCANDLVK